MSSRAFGMRYRNLRGSPVPALIAVISDGGDKPFAAMEAKAQDLHSRRPTTLPTPVIDGPTATYAGTADGGDLMVTATGDAADEVRPALAG